jgi:hypothetical protein
MNERDLKWLASLGLKLGDRVVATYRELPDGTLMKLATRIESDPDTAAPPSLLLGGTQGNQAGSDRFDRRGPAVP